MIGFKLRQGAVVTLKSKQFNFQLLWAIATVLGFGISLLTVEVGTQGDLKLLAGLMGGGIVGLSQSLIVGYWLFDSWLWILVNAMGWGLMAGTGLGAIGWFVPATQLLAWRIILGFLSGSLGGAWLGAWQWLYLRQQISHAERWILGSAVIWGLGLAVGWGIGNLLHHATQLFLGEVIGLGATWLIVGLGTGWLLSRLTILRDRPTT
jgi:hypothetical protein